MNASLTEALLITLPNLSYLPGHAAILVFNKGNYENVFHFDIVEKLRCTSQMSQNKKFKNENFKKENCSKTFRGHFENMSNLNGENIMLHIYTDIDCVIS